MRPGLALGFCMLMLFAFSGCMLLTKKETPQPDLNAITQKPLSPEDTEGLVSEVGKNWWYGQGVGETALAAGTSILFPPYAIYALGNAALDVSGYEELRVTNLLPDEAKAGWNDVYDGVTGAPGTLNANIAGEEFRTRDAAKAHLDVYLKKVTVEENQAR